MKDRKESGRSGTQTIERAVALLRTISTRGRHGWQLSELAQRCELRPSTTHRILGCLVREGFVGHRPDERTYVPGSVLFELGLSFYQQGELQHAAKKRLEALARRVNGTAFLFFRSGDDFVCAARIGDAKLRAPVYPGTRKPLILSTGGAAMLIALPEKEATAIMDRNIADLSKFDKARVRSIRPMLERSFAEGFGVSLGDIFPAINSFSVPLCDATGAPYAAITVAGSARALPQERRAEYRNLLEETARGLRGSTR